MTTPDSPIINIADALNNDEFIRTVDRRGAFEARIGLIGAMLGTEKIGINITVVPPRSKAWPKHFHYTADEMVIVLEGEGTLHYGDNRYALKPNDVAHLPAGTGKAHQVENTSDAELRYLCLSSLDPADVFVYPDSNKVGFMAGAAPFRDFSAAEGRLPSIRRWVTDDMSAGYWDGEPDAAEE